MARLRFSAKAQTQLKALVAYIAEDSPSRARAFRDRLKRRCGILARWPHRGRRRPELGSNVRSFPVDTVVVFYQTFDEGREVEIIRIIDGRRDLGTVFFSPLAA